jgi:hypothetical protein
MAGFDLRRVIFPPVPVKSQNLYLLLYSFAEHLVIHRILTIDAIKAVDCDRQVLFSLSILLNAISLLFHP